jgi:hypothetical protein
LRDALLSAYNQGGPLHPDLQGPPLPPEIEHVWRWFDDLQSARGNSGFGLNPLSYSELQAWATMTHCAPTPFEVRLLKDLDLLYLAEMSRRSSEQELTQ